MSTCWPTTSRTASDSSNGTTTSNAFAAASTRKVPVSGASVPVPETSATGGSGVPPGPCAVTPVGAGTNSPGTPLIAATTPATGAVSTVSLDVPAGAGHPGPRVVDQGLLLGHVERPVAAGRGEVVLRGDHALPGVLDRHLAGRPRRSAPAARPPPPAVLAATTALSACCTADSAALVSQVVVAERGGRPGWRGRRAGRAGRPQLALRLRPGPPPRLRAACGPARWPTEFASSVASTSSSVASWISRACARLASGAAHRGVAADPAEHGLLLVQGGLPLGQRLAQREVVQPGQHLPGLDPVADPDQHLGHPAAVGEAELLLAGPPPPNRTR